MSSVLAVCSHFFSEESVRRQPQAIQLHMLLKVVGQERFE